MNQKINVYLFWGDGCPHCEVAKMFFKKIAPELGQYFELKEYEVWYNQENEKMLNTIATQLNHEARTVPYIVIGDKVFGTVTKEVEEEIKKTIITMAQSSTYKDLIHS